MKKITSLVFLIILFYPKVGHVSGVLINIENLVKRTEYICLVQSSGKAKMIKENTQVSYELMSFKVLELIKFPDNSLIAPNETIDVVTHNSFHSNAAMAGISLSAVTYDNSVDYKKSERFIVYLSDSRIDKSEAPKIWNLGVLNAFDHENKIPEIKKILKRNK